MPRLHLLALSILGFVAQPAYAECSKSLSSSIYNEYAYPDTGKVYWGKPVIQTDAELGCGDLTYDLWNSSQFSGSGSYGARGYGDEVDMIGTFDHSYDSSIGAIAVEASGAYRVLDNFSQMKDDQIALYLQAGRPFAIDDALTIAPYLRATTWVGVSGQTLWFVRPGASASWKFDDAWSLSVNGSYSVDLAEHYGVLNAEAALTHDFGGGFSGILSLQLTERIPPMIGIGVQETF